MSTIRQKLGVLEPILEVFKKEGKVLTAHEYRQINPVPIRYAMVLNYFASWDRMCNVMAKLLPEEFAKIGVKPAATPKPVAAPKPAATTAPAKSATTQP